MRTRRTLLLWLGSVVLLGLLLFAYRHLEVLANHGTESPLRPLINELTGAFAVGLMYFPARRLVGRLPLIGGTWPRRLPVYLIVMLVLAALVTTVIWGFRTLIYPLAGLGPYDYGVMPLRYFMELPIQAVAFALTVWGIHAWNALDAARRRELRDARLAGNLARAQLQNLRLQLQPHFLFNALNTISATMYEDPAAADEMLGGLAELLRSSLRTAQSDEVPLEEELAILDRYLDLMRARFGERLAVSIDLDPAAAGALVPSLILQPLVENAIRHGNAERAGRGAIAVRARTEGGRLLLEVEDDGPGDARRNGHRTGHRSESGVGLAATAERLRILYGDEQTFSAGDGAAGGFLARATLPLRRATAS
ncbi:MAG TPA: histidine kinase [Thermoanaerobaculia bacterium]|jgi:signal transduction histidine kinase